MTNAQSKLLPKFNHINMMGRKMTHNFKQAGMATKQSGRKVRVKIVVEKDTDDIEFWNGVVSKKRELYNFKDV